MKTTGTHNTRGGQTLRCSQGGVAAGGPGTAAPRQAPTATGGSPVCSRGLYPAQANFSTSHCRPGNRLAGSSLSSITVVLVKAALGQRLRSRELWSIMVDKALAGGCSSPRGTLWEIGARYPEMLRGQDAGNKRSQRPPPTSWEAADHPRPPWKGSRRTAPSPTSEPLPGKPDGCPSGRGSSRRGKDRKKCLFMPKKEHQTTMILWVAFKRLNTL